VCAIDVDVRVATRTNLVAFPSVPYMISIRVEPCGDISMRDHPTAVARWLPLPFQFCQNVNGLINIAIASVRCGHRHLGLGLGLGLGQFIAIRVPRRPRRRLLAPCI
jgi:hypothetical protein